MTTDDKIDAAMASLLFIWLAGIPISFGYMAASGVHPVGVVYGCFVWPLVVLGWFGAWMAGAA